MITRIRLLVCLLITLFIYCSAVQAQQLRITNAIPNPICAGQSFTIYYSANQPGTLYVYLSNVQPEVTKVVTGKGDNLTVTATIPSNQAAGNYGIYLVNVVSTVESYTSGTVNNFIINPTPQSPPIVTTPAPYCPGDAATPLNAAVTASGNTLRWYGLNATGGSFTSDAPKPSTNQAGTFPYYVSQANTYGCESGRAAINVTVNPKPDKPVTKSLSACQNAVNPPLITSGVTASGNNTLKWYTTIQPTEQPIPTPTPSTNVVGPMTYTYYVSQTNQFGCESDRVAIMYTINGLPPAPTIPAQTTLYCQNTQAAQLQAIPIAGASLNFYTAQTGVSPTPTLIPSTVDAIPKIYYVSQTDINGCETTPANRASITIVTVSNPERPTVSSSPLTYCQGENAPQLTATPTTTNTLRWYDRNATGGPFTTTAPKPATDTPGSAVYYVSQIDGNQCEGPRAGITVTVTAKPTPPTTTNITACQSATGSPISLAKGVTAVGTLKWYTSPSGGSAVNEPILSVANAGTSSSYYVSQVVNNCESDINPVPVQLIVKPTPPAPMVSSAPVLVCQGVQADFLSATATANATLIWYDPVTGATSSSIRPRTEVATDINNPTPYPVSQTFDGCEGPKATVYVVTVAKPVPPTVLLSSLAICQSSPTFSLTASGQNLKWYTDPKGGTALPKAPDIATDQVKTLTYYVSQTNLNNCESERTTITVEIKPKPNSPGVAPIGFCANQATSLTATFDGGAIPNWYGTNSSGTPSQTAPVPSTAVIGTPVLYYVSQTVNGCESEKASIVVTIKGLPDVPSVNSVQGPYCQDIQALPLTATVTNGVILRWYTTANGGTASTTALTPSTSLSATVQPVLYYVSQVNTESCEGPRAAISVTVNAKPAKPIVTASSTVCQSTSSVTLSAQGTNLKWYADNATTTVIATPVISTTAPGTFTYFVSQTDTKGCESDRASITTTITPAPAPPTTAPISFCQNTTQPTTLTATAAPGGTLNWYYTQSGGTASPFISATTSVANTTTYYVSQNLNGCESQRVGLEVTTRPLPILPLVSTVAVPLCQGTAPAPLSATVTTAGNTLKWYYTQTDATAYPSIAPPTTNTGPSSYFVSQTDQYSCESARAQVTVNVKPKPTAPTVSSNLVTLCQNTPAQTLTAVTVGTQNWYTVQEGGTPTPSIIQPTTSPGTFTYFVSQTYDLCESNRTSIIVTVQATPLVPTVGTNPIYCQGSTSSITPLSASAPNGGTLLWYTQKIGGVGTVTPPVPPVASATTFTYYVSQSVGICESDRVMLVATIKSPPDIPTVTPSVTTCQNGTAVLTAALKGGVSLNYYTPTGNVSTIAPVPDTRTAGSFPYYVSQVDANGCESSRATITVRVNALPSAPSVSPVSFCQGATQATLPVIPSLGTVYYYTAQSGGVGSATPPAINTANPTTTFLFVSQTDGSTGCESPRSTLSVTITPTPAAPAVPVIAPVCQGSPAVVVTAAGTNLKWYADASSNLTTQPIVPTTLVGPAYLFVSQTINGCESNRTPVTVVINAQPLAPTVASNQSGCQDANVPPLTAVGTALQWYNQNDELIAAPTPNTKVDVAQTYTYKVTQTVNGCVSPKTNVPYTVNITPVPTVGPQASFCQNTLPAQLTATATAGTLRWYDPTGVVSAVAPIIQPTTVSTGASYSVAQVGSNGCESRKAEIRVTITTAATAKLESRAGTSPIYLGGSANLALTLTGAGPYSYTLSDGTTGVVASAVGSATTVQPISVTPTSAGTVSYLVTAVSNTCGIGTVNPVAAVVDVRSQTITAGQPSPLTICTGQSISIPFTSVGDFVTGNQFTVEIGKASDDPLSRQYIPIPGAASQSPISVTIPSSIAAGQYVVRVNATNGRSPVLGVPNSATLTIRGLPTVTLSTSLTINRGQSTTLNFAFTGDPYWTVKYLVGTDPTIQTFTTNLNPYPLPITPKDTTTYRVVGLANDACGSVTPTGTISAKINVLTVLAAEDLLGNSVRVYPVPTDGAVTVDIDIPLAKEAAQLRLVRSDGRVADQVTTKQKQTILPLDKEPAGVYLLHITIGDRSTVRRILKR